MLAGLEGYGNPNSGFPFSVNVLSSEAKLSMFEFDEDSEFVSLLLDVHRAGTKLRKNCRARDPVNLL